MNPSLKYIDEFRNPKMAKGIVQLIEKEANPNRHYRLMEFCGGHTSAIYRYGIVDLIPKNIEMIHGPGCPVCVLPVSRLDSAIFLAREPNVIFSTYADLMRVPASHRSSLMQAKAEGADIKPVYSTLDALKIAESHPQNEVVFMAIGFETTTPPTALTIQTAKKRGLKNFTVLCNHVLTPAALRAIARVPNNQLQVDGFIGPGHVSTVIGSHPYEACANHFRRPIVLSGFEPLDILQSILMLIRQINQKKNLVEIQYTRVIRPEGNPLALSCMKDVFTVRDSFEWRGLGHIPHSALQIAEKYKSFDAETRFSFSPPAAQETTPCICGDILRGLKKPRHCQLFGKSCTPETPMGACMVSSEGACAAWYHYGKPQERQCHG